MSLREPGQVGEQVWPDIKSCLQPWTEKGQWTKSTQFRSLDQFIIFGANRPSWNCVQRSAAKSYECRLQGGLPALPMPKAMNGYTVPLTQSRGPYNLWHLHMPRKDDCHWQVAGRGPIHSSDLPGRHLSSLSTQHTFTVIHYHCHYHLQYVPDTVLNIHTRYS